MRLILSVGCDLIDSCSNSAGNVYATVRVDGVKVGIRRVVKGVNDRRSVVKVDNGN